MPDRSPSYDELKRKIRKLKGLEIKIRFGGAGQPPAADLVWDAFFDLHALATGKAKYTLRRLSEMGRVEYHNVIDEFFFNVYFRYYKENGFVNLPLYDPELLAHFGLPADADGAAIKRKFHELALKYHPDAGGDAEKFIVLMKDYRKLIEKGN